jgi:DNA repair exonuclease SbcCD ATPase subunit
LSEKLVSFSDKLKFYEEHKEIIENMKCLIQELESKKKQISDFNSLIKQQEQDLTKLYKEHGSLEQKIENIKNNEAEKATLQRQYAAYELFMRCMHNNGIAFDLIKKNLPLVNQEIAKVLSNIVEFEVYFENTDNKLDIFIKHPKYDARPLENGSGAEKTLAAMAIRIALLNISNMPKPNIFILDEPGTALDSDNMEGFVRILELIKGYFDITVLITHIDALKDSVDTTIEISKNNGFAQVKI